MSKVIMKVFMPMAAPTRRMVRRRASVAVIGAVSIAVVAAGCAKAPNSADTRSAGGTQQAAGNPMELPALAQVTDSGPPSASVMPVFGNARVSPRISTSVSTEPTIDTEDGRCGACTIQWTEIAPSQAIDWSAARSASISGKKYKLVPSQALKNGESYLWRVLQGGQPIGGPYSFTVDVSAAKKQETDGSSVISVATATGVAHYTWQTQKMESASGSIALGLDYSPVNTDWPGVPSGWRLVTPSSVAYDRLQVRGDGTAIKAVRIHSKDNSWVSYVPNANGFFAPVAQTDTKLMPPTGMYGTLVQNGDKTFTLTDMTGSVTTFSVPNENGASWIRGVALSGQRGIEQEYDPANGLPVVIRDSISGKFARVLYGGSEGCPSPSASFIPVPQGNICQVRFWDGTTSSFDYVNITNQQNVQVPVLARLASYPEAGVGGAQVTDLAYDSSGRLAAVRTPTIAAAAAAAAAGNADARAVAGSDPAAGFLLAKATYDDQGRVTSTTAPAKSASKPGGRLQVNFSYKPELSQTTITASPTGTTTRVTYDADLPEAHSTLTTVKKEYKASSMANLRTISKVDLDANGNPTRTVDAIGGVTESKYDDNGVVVERVGAYIPGQGARSGAPQSSYRYDTWYSDPTKPSEDGGAEPGGKGSPMFGLDVHYWANAEWKGAAATNELGPLPTPTSPALTAASVMKNTWQVSPVPGVDKWSARMSGQLMLPDSAASGDKQDQAGPDVYRFVLEGPNRPQLWVDQIKCVAGDPQFDCQNTGIQLTPGPHQVRIDMSADQSAGNPPSVQLMWGRNGGGLEVVPVQKSLVFRGVQQDLKIITPAYYLNSEQANPDQTKSGTNAKSWTRTSYSQPQVGQVSKTWNNAGLATTTQYETAGRDGELADRAFGEGVAAFAKNNARVTGTVLPKGAQSTINYWRDDESAASGCPNQDSHHQGGRPKEAMLPDSTTGKGTALPTTTWYMDDGSLAALQTGSQPKVCFYYDAVMRVSSSGWSGAGSSGTVTYNYAVDGNPLVTSVSTVTDGGQPMTNTVTSDLLGNAISTTDQWGTTQVSAYTAEGKLDSTTTTTASGYWAKTKFTYATDVNGNTTRHVEVTDSIHGNGAVQLLAADASFDPAGRLSSVTFSNGTAGATRYNGYELPENLSWTDSRGQAWQSTNTYSMAGRILESLRSNGSQSARWAYTYDGAKRLTEAVLDTNVPTVPIKKWQYEYDGDSNRTSQTVTKTGGDSYKIDYSYDAADRLTHLANDPELGTSDVSYDDSGNITKMGPLEITYGPLSNVTFVKDTTTNESVAYRYDASLNVVAKTTTDAAGAEATILFSQGGVLLDASKNPFLHQVTLPGGVTVQRQLADITKPAPAGPAAPASPAALAADRNAAVRGAAQVSRGPKPRKKAKNRRNDVVEVQTWIYPDLKGDTLFSADSSGSSAATATGAGGAPASLPIYDPFGQSLTASAVPAGDQAPQYGWKGSGGFETQNFGASAEKPGVQTMLMGARLYVPALGRYTQVDPERGGAANNYDFALQDPINVMDNSGQGVVAQIFSILAGVVISIIAAIATAGASVAIEASAMAALSTTKAVLAVIAVGAGIGAAAGAATYAANVAITGTSWSWTGFASSVGIGVISGAWSGYSAFATIGQAVLAEQTDILGIQAAADSSGNWFQKAGRWLGGKITGAVNKYMLKPLQQSRALLEKVASGGMKMTNGAMATEAAMNSAAVFGRKVGLVSLFCGAGFGAISTAGSAVAGPGGPLENNFAGKWGAKGGGYGIAFLGSAAVC